MPTDSSTNKKKNAKGTAKSPQDLRLVLWILDLIQTYGPFSVLAGFIIFCLQTWTTVDQKRAIIDAYVLFHAGDRFHYFSLVVILLISLLVLQKRHYGKIIEHKDNEIQRISDVKNDLQRNLTKRDLHRSN